MTSFWRDDGGGYADMTGEPSTADQVLGPISAGRDATQKRWLETRAYLNSHRYQLTQTAEDLYPASWRVAGTPLLARPEWLPTTPIRLDHVGLSWRGDSVKADVTGTEPQSEAVRPLRNDGTRFASYAEALGALRRPSLFEDRACYRIVNINTASTPALEFTDSSYFDIINVCEAVAHEYAAAALADGYPDAVRSVAELPLRALVNDPTDLHRRPVIPAISTLTIRLGHNFEDVQMILHWRDPAKVASGGGLYQVAPVGVFQPSHDAPWNRTNDFSLWRAIAREMSEELLGCGENYHSEVRPIDYERWPFYAALEAASQAGTLRLYWLGLGIDPLTLVADMLTVAVFDAPLFDRTFTGLVAANDEGHFLTDGRPDGSTIGFPFNSATIERFADAEPIQPAGAALLRTAWQHRVQLLT